MPNPADFVNALPALPVAIPLLTAAFLASIRKYLIRPVVDVIAICASAINLWLCIELLLDTRAKTIVYWFGNWYPRGSMVLGITFVIDPISAGLAKDLTINYRSVPRIVAAANSLAGRNDTAHRNEPATDNGAFFLPFSDGEENKLITAFEAAVRSAGLDLSKCAVVCRATKKKQALRNLGQEYGQGSTKLFASATMARDLAGDYNEAFRLTVFAIVELLKNPPQQICAAILDPLRSRDFRGVRKLVWEFTRDSVGGLPSGSLHMQLTWHAKLLVNVKALMERLKLDHQLAPQDNLNMRLKKTGLPDRALIDGSTAKTVIDKSLRVETIHGVKGESLDAVLYLADKDHVKAMVNGTGTELGRIGYVALTRARDLFWLGILKTDAKTYGTALTGHNFVERQYDAQLDLPLESTA